METMKDHDRLMRVFISSTFRDLMEERTYLMNRVFPMLRSLGELHNVTVVPVDLRWGITDEESENMTHSAKVVDLCLREINNSQPFFIGITGQRYGWCPSAYELGGLFTQQSSQKWITSCLNGNMSVTELEMQYGVWKNPRWKSRVRLTPEGEIAWLFHLATGQGESQEWGSLFGALF